MFRLAVARAVLSSEEINNRNRIILDHDQAQAVWALDEVRVVWDFEKTLGMGYDGEEEDQDDCSNGRN
ncbi:hypothetical protein RHMOL_Rhmol11G0115500 [Rhododendron molle]|uniref:Uncharacterized protein n=1 Tax=Rhododendron molle TaxID=49168 RepID=A0ACC0LR67_RHOML|nr:hypothetical protein RHMOL_Rhmol11G0115500 [Rhododendron molle]